MEIAGNTTLAIRRTPVSALFLRLAKSLRLPFVLLAVTLAAGCTPERNGPTLDGLTRKIGTPKANQSRIVVIRPKEWGHLIDAGWQVYLDGAVMGDVKTGTFIYRNVRTGPHTLSFARGGDFARASTHKFVSAPGRTYVFRLEPNGNYNLVAASTSSAGLAGLLVSSMMVHALDKRGLFDFTPLEGDAAKQALADLRLAE